MRLLRHLQHWLELLKHEVGASDEAICERLRTDVAVMYAWGLEEAHTFGAGGVCVA
jgi:hypothetical protein